MKKIYLKKSSIEGDGIFAGENIKKGEFILLLRGTKIRRKYNNEKDQETFSRWFGVGKDFWIDPKLPLSHINHSCNPNVGIRARYQIIALKNIRKGQELTLDYSICDSETDWSIKCNCGSKNCRKIIRSIQFLPEKTFKKYLPNVPNYFQKIYLDSKKINKK